eukprot:2185841-Rhodomonas_salina.2
MLRRAFCAVTRVPGVWVLRACQYAAMCVPGMMLRVGATPCRVLTERMALPGHRRSDAGERGGEGRCIGLGPGLGVRCALCATDLAQAATSTVPCAVLTQRSVLRSVRY